MLFLSIMLGLLLGYQSQSTLSATAPPRFIVTPGPVFEGPYAFVGDPSVVRTVSGQYRMYHNGLDVEREPQGGVVCVALSEDGLEWNLPETPLGTPLVPGRVTEARIGSWDEAHETPFALLGKDATTLFIIGYQGDGFTTVPGSSRIGRATSADGMQFNLAPKAPIITPDKVGADAYGVTSPSIIRTADGMWVLCYTGWCAAPFSCPRGEAPIRLTLLTATSTDGMTWTRRAEPVVVDPGLQWTNGGISETTVVRGPDGNYYLFFSSLAGDEGSRHERQRIGLARSADPFGPFVFDPDPIISPEDLGSWANGGVLAPTVLFEADRIRLWFHAFEVDVAGQLTAARIGYAEAPLDAVLVAP